MQILLLKSLDNLGTQGDIVEVAPGYARNYLIPRKLGLISTPETIKLQAKLRRSSEKKVEEGKDHYLELGEKIASLSRTIAVKAKEDGQLFGSVTAVDIARLLNDHGVRIDRKMIELEAPIKSLGVYTVPIKLPLNVETTTKLWVVSETQEKSS